MFVFIRLLVVDASQSASATMSYGRWSVRASRLVIFAPPRLSKRRAQTWIREYQRRHHPNGPKRRCSIHDRPTCPFSADDGAYAGHWKGPRPVSYEINLRFRRFSSRTGHLTGLIVYYIAPRPKDARRGSSGLRPHNLANLDLIPGPATISPCTITMDHDAIICSMIDRLARGPDQDVHVPSVGSQKYPSYEVDVIYL
jgi:hypothetical protein